MGAANLFALQSWAISGNVANKKAPNLNKQSPKPPQRKSRFVQTQGQRGRRTTRHDFGNQCCAFHAAALHSLCSNAAPLTQQDCAAYAARLQNLRSKLAVSGICRTIIYRPKPVIGPPYEDRVIYLWLSKPFRPAKMHGGKTKSLWTQMTDLG